MGGGVTACKFQLEEAVSAQTVDLETASREAALFFVTRRSASVPGRNRKYQLFDNLHGRITKQSADHFKSGPFICKIFR